MTQVIHTIGGNESASVNCNLAIIPLACFGRYRIL
jgi:hypothetical protein